jgi:hypothetical protein
MPFRFLSLFLFCLLDWSLYFLLKLLMIIIKNNKKLINHHPGIFVYSFSFRLWPFWNLSKWNSKYSVYHIMIAGSNFGKTTYLTTENSWRLLTVYTFEIITWKEKVDIFVPFANWWLFFHSSRCRGRPFGPQPYNELKQVKFLCKFSSPWYSFKYLEWAY